MSYPITNAVNLPTPIGGILNGSYINFDSLPESIKILLSNPKYVVLVREREITQTSGGGRTIGTVWYNKQVLGFTVEDAVRNKKIALKTAIPDTIEDTSKFNGIPSNVYNIILSTYTSKEFIRKSFYNGKGMRVSSKGDPSGGNIYESDVFVSDNFATDKGRVAFDGVFIHQGSSENSSAGCIIFSKTRNNDGTLISSETAVQNLNKYLQSIKLIGPGKLQQFAIINLFELPEPPTIINTSVIMINSETNQPIQGVKVEKTNSSEEGLNTSPPQLSPSIELQVPPPNTP
jgi:hypothetical protein